MTGRGYRARQKAYKRKKRQAEREQQLELQRRRAQSRGGQADGPHHSNG
jgi:hypothetical protein